MLRSKMFKAVVLAAMLSGAVAAGMLLSNHASGPSSSPPQEHPEASDGLRQQNELSPAATEQDPASGLMRSSTDVLFEGASRSMSLDSRVTTEAFAAINKGALSFDITGYGTSHEVASARAFAVASVFLAQGVPSEKISLKASVRAGAEAAYVKGASVSALVFLEKDLGNREVNRKASVPTPVVGSPLPAPGFVMPTPLPAPEGAASTASQGQREVAATISGPVPAQEVSSAVAIDTSRLSSGLARQRLPEDLPGGVHIQLGQAKSGRHQGLPASGSGPISASPEAMSVPEQGVASFEVMQFFKDSVMVRSGNQVLHVGVGSLLPNGKTLKSLDAVQRQISYD